MSAPNSTDWMWTQAWELLAQAERMHRQFFRLAASERPQASWEPPVDVFEDEREVVIVVALPGVPAERIEVTSEPGALLIRAESTLPFAGSRPTVRRLEIPYGYFERRVMLPGVRLEAGTQELAHGCLTLRLRKIG
jgi:HSP20 family protein